MVEEREIDILKHALVPEHSVLSGEERAALLQELKITTGQLPKILAADPVVKAMGAKPGDVLKIIRKSRTAGTATYYRLVVKGGE